MSFRRDVWLLVGSRRVIDKNMPGYTHSMIDTFLLVVPLFKISIGVSLYLAPVDEKLISP